MPPQSPCRSARPSAAALSNVFFGLTLAQVLGVPAGGFLAYAVSWQASFLAVAALAAPMLVGLWLLTPRGLSFQPTRLATLGEALADWRVLIAVLFTSTYLAAIYVPYTYLAPLLSETMGFEGRGITVVLLVFGLGAVAGNLLGGRLSDRVGARRTLLGLALLQIALMPLFSTLPLAAPALFTLVFVWALCGWSFMAPQQIVLIRLAPSRHNVTLALNAAAIYLGAAAGSAIGALVIVRFGLLETGLAGGLRGFLALGNHWLAGRAAPRPAIG